MKLKKDGLVAGILEALVEEERKKVAEKRPDIAYNQKNTDQKDGWCPAYYRQVI